MTASGSARTADQPILTGGEVPRLRWLIRVLFVLLVLGIAVAGYAAYMFLGVQAKIDQQRRELASNAAVASTALADVAVVQKQFAQLNSGNCASVAGLNTWIRGQTSEERNRIPGVAGLLNALQSVCASGQGGYSASDAFMTRYVPGVVARQKGDYAAADQAYQAASQVPGAQKDLLARAYEGSAYSNLKLGRLDAAAAAARAGEALGVDYVFTQITALKLSCARRAPASDVQRQFSAALAQRQRAIDTAADETLLDTAKADRQLLLNDPELEHMCGYARLKGLAG